MELRELLDCDHTLRCLEKAGVTTLEQLVCCTYADLLAMRGVGKVIAGDLFARITDYWESQVREAGEGDLPGLLELYLSLHESQVPEREAVLPAWQKIQADPDHHLLLLEDQDRPASSCVCVIVPNLTRGGRPYALIENVVTRESCRGRGMATACLRRAVALAREAGCYKVMLLTGSKDPATLAFYRRAGFQDGEKTAFQLRL